MKKIRKHLENKDKNQYTFLDAIFADYLNGQINELLSSRGFTSIEFFYQIHKKGNYLQIECQYNNFVVTMEFRETEYDFGFYIPGCSADEFARCINTFQYYNDFAINKFLEELCGVLKNDSRLIE